MNSNLECHNRRNVFDKLREFEDHIRCCTVLFYLAVDLNAFTNVNQRPPKKPLHTIGGHAEGGGGSGE